MPPDSADRRSRSPMKPNRPVAASSARGCVQAITSKPSRPSHHVRASSRVPHGDSRPTDTGTYSARRHTAAGRRRRRRESNGAARAADEGRPPVWFAATPVLEGAENAARLHRGRSHAASTSGRDRGVSTLGRFGCLDGCLHAGVRARSMWPWRVISGYRWSCSTPRCGGRGRGLDAPARRGSGVRNIAIGRRLQSLADARSESVDE